MTLAVESYCARVHREVAAYAADLRAFLHVAECRPYRQVEGVIMPARGEWIELDDAGTGMRLRLLDAYAPVFDKLTLLYQDLPDDLRKGPAQAVEFIKGLVMRDQLSVAIPASREEALSELADHLDAIERLLAVLQAKDGDVACNVIVPDTSVLIETANLLALVDRLDTSAPIEIVLLMSVTAELDVKKHDKNNKEAAQRARSAIRSIDQVASISDLSRGAEFASGVRVRTVVEQPDLGRYGSWARTVIVDDQILASTLDLAVARPNTPVILATNDISMRTRAHALGIPGVAIERAIDSVDD